MLRHAANKGQWDAAVIVPLHDLKKVDAEDLENHDKVLPVGTRMDERVQKLHCMTVFNAVSAFFLEVRVIDFVLVDSVDPILNENVLGDDIKNLYLIVSCLRVVRSALLHLESDVRIIHHVTC